VVTGAPFAGSSCRPGAVHGEGSHRLQTGISVDHQLFVALFLHHHIKYAIQRGQWINGQNLTSY